MLPIIHTRSIPQHISDPLQYKSGRTPTGSHYDSPPSFVRSFRQLLPFPPNSHSKPSPPICCRWNSAATTRASTTSVDRLVTGDPPETQTNKKSQDTNLHHATNTVQIRAQASLCFKSTHPHSTNAGSTDWTRRQCRLPTQIGSEKLHRRTTEQVGGNQFYKPGNSEISNSLLISTS